MNIWNILRIERTTDKRAIKRAYGKMIVLYHPEEYPDEFKEIHEAYEQALEYAESYGGKSETGTLRNVSMERSPFHAIEEVHDLVDTKEREPIDFSKIKYEKELHDSAQDVLSRDDVDFSAIKDEKVLRYSGKENSHREKMDFSTIEDDRLRYHADEELPKHLGVDFSSVDENEEYPRMEEEIVELIGAFSKLIYSQKNWHLGSWKKLLKSPVFFKVHVTESFIKKFTRLIENVRLTKKIARLVYGNLDFDQMEKTLPFFVYAELKELLLSDIEGRKRKANGAIKNGSFWVAFFVVWYVGIFILKAALLHDEPAEMESVSVSPEVLSKDPIRSGVSDNKSDIEKRCEKMLVKKYGGQFDAQELEHEPQDIMEVYYLIADGKGVSDYKWLTVKTTYQDIDVQFYVSWSEAEGFCYDYVYRQMFAIIDHVGLGNYLEDKDEFNAKYYNSGEKRYCYPVLRLDGIQDDLFYEKIEQCITLIQNSDDIFTAEEMVKLNFINPNTGVMYNMEIEKKWPTSLSDVQGALDRLATGEY